MNGSLKLSRTISATMIPDLTYETSQNYLLNLFRKSQEYFKENLWIKKWPYPGEITLVPKLTGTKQLF